MSDGRNQDDDLDGSALKVVTDNVSEIASKDKPVEQGPGEEPYCIGSHNLRNRDKVKKRDFKLYKSLASML